jgi:hypothetical protein
MIVSRIWLPRADRRIGFRNGNEDFPAGYHDSEGLLLAADGNLPAYLYF